MIRPRPSSPGETHILGVDRRDLIAGGGREVVVDVEIRSTALEPPRTCGESMTVARRTVRAVVVCSIDRARPLCAKPVPYAVSSRSLKYAPLDLLRRERGRPPVRAWLLSP